MDGYLIALGFALLPAVSNFGGGLLAELVPVREDMLSYALHGATGVVLAVVGLELMPEALSVSSPWVPIVAFILGSGFFLLADKGRIQVVAATSSLNRSAGVSQFSVFRGRSLRSRAISSSRSWVWTDRSLPLGRN